MTVHLSGGTRGVLDRPYLLLVSTMLFWGGNSVAGKAAVGSVPPMALTTFRWLLACILLLIIGHSHIRQDWSIIKRHWKQFFVFGALGMAAFNILMYNALYYTSAINVTIEQSGMPMIIVLVNLLIFRERVSPTMLVGMSLSIGGVLVTAAHGDLTTLFDLEINQGDALMLIAVLIYAFYSVILRNRPQLHWLSFMMAVSVGALITSLPFFAYEMSQGIVFEPSTKGVLLIAYVTIFPSIVSQIFYARSVDLIGANRAGLFVNLVPLFGSALAILLIGEEAALYHIVGYALILAGIYIAQRR